MKVFGILLILAGAAAALFSFFTDVSVGSSYGSGGIINIGLLQQQMMVFQLGLGGFISGTILFAVGSALEALQLPKQSSVGSAEKIIGFDPKDHI
jgi:hypothetical protein